MRSIYSTIIRSALLVLAIACCAFTVPPYLWYATHSIEDYTMTGCHFFLNLFFCHEEASGFSNAIVSLNLPCQVRYVYNRHDDECTAARWTGMDAEINGVDFLFYSGHGCATGPYLGCNSTYQVTNWSDIRFGGSGYLKWVQAAACNWFIPDEMDEDCATGMSVFQRWTNCFQGVHIIQGHRAATYDHSNYDSMSTEFWNRWVCWNEIIYYAWRDAQIKWVYERSSNRGLQPASATPTHYYLCELWQDATDAPAPTGMGYLVWATVGIPEY